MTRLLQHPSKEKSWPPPPSSIRTGLDADQGGRRSSLWIMFKNKHIPARAAEAKLVTVSTFCPTNILKTDFIHHTWILAPSGGVADPDPETFRPLDPGWVKNQDPDPGFGMNILDHISKRLETIFWDKILKFLMKQILTNLVISSAENCKITRGLARAQKTCHHLGPEFTQLFTRKIILWALKNFWEKNRFKKKVMRFPDLTDLDPL